MITTLARALPVIANRAKTPASYAIMIIITGRNGGTITQQPG